MGGSASLEKLVSPSPMLNWQQLKNAYSGKRVFLTGHTGFKGAWLLYILHQMGAEIKGYALPPEHKQDLYNQLAGGNLCHSVFADIGDAEKLREELVSFQPDFVFHLAAQALVRRSYRQPLDTFRSNTMGTAYLLEALREVLGPATAVIITTDKVYENDERGTAFPESAPLGGYDPYSASKAAAEIVISSYRRSFFPLAGKAVHQKGIYALRAGNVIGGGDFSEDRLIPDMVRAIESGQPVILRNPQSVRPWQHVLEPLVAYLILGAQAAAGKNLPPALNIGPDRTDERTVAKVASAFYAAFGKTDAPKIALEPAMHEAGLLMLDNTLIKEALGWKPQLTAEEAIRWTADWYAGTAPAAEKCEMQTMAYFERVNLLANHER